MPATLAFSCIAGTSIIPLSFNECKNMRVELTNKRKTKEEAEEEEEEEEGEVGKVE
jgi:hypothetical protein